MCARLLREHAGLFGRTDAYTIYDQADLRRVIEWLLADRRRPELRDALARCGQPPAAELETRDRARQEPPAVTPTATAAAHGTRPPTSSPPSGAPPTRSSSAATRSASTTCSCARCGCWPSTRSGARTCAARWRWLLVDEMQDTNEAQAALVHLLAGPAGNLTVVGDADQAIYRFRSAEPRNMLAFGERQPDHRRIALTRNFRSRAEILAAAGACIAHTPGRDPKPLVAVARRRRAGDHARVRAPSATRPSWAAGLIADALAAGTAPGEVLVLARTAYATAPVQVALAAAGIPHRVLGSLGLYERAEVRDALAHLALLSNPADAQAFRRAVQAPRRGIGTATAGRVIAAAREHHGGDLIAASAHAHTLTGVRSQADARAARRVRRRPRGCARAVARRALARARRRRHRHARRRARRPPPAAPRPLAAPRERAPRRRARARGPALAVPRRAGVLRPARLRRVADRLPRARRRPARRGGAGPARTAGSPSPRSTAPRAPRPQLVVLLACEEQLLPSWRALESPDPEDLAEERRLFYVAATRAKDTLVITRAHVRAGRPTGGPSRFLAEAGLATQARPLAA